MRGKKYVIDKYCNQLCKKNLRIPQIIPMVANVLYVQCNTITKRCLQNVDYALIKVQIMCA